MTNVAMKKVNATNSRNYNNIEVEIIKISNSTPIDKLTHIPSQVNWSLFLYPSLHWH